MVKRVNVEIDSNLFTEDKKSLDLCQNCKNVDKIKVLVSEGFPLSSCELCEILQSFVEGFSYLNECKP